MLRDLLAGLTDLIYPASCILCKTHLTPLEKAPQLCFACQGKLTRNKPPFCRRCSRPPEDPRHAYCLTCQQMPIQFDQAWGVFLYNDTMQKLLHLYKYGQKSGLRFFFSQQMALFLDQHYIDPKQFDFILAVPLHPSRQRRRGYNQSELLAVLLAQTLEVPLKSDGLVRTRATPNQARLHQKERWTNIEAAFKIKNSNGLRNSRVLIVDDLLTTGATVSQAAMTLKNAGASQVKVLTLAVAMPEKPHNENP